VNELWDAAENLDQACENCHRRYWYPGETHQFYGNSSIVVYGTSNAGSANFQPAEITRVSLPPNMP